MKERDTDRIALLLLVLLPLLLHTRPLTGDCMQSACESAETYNAHGSLLLSRLFC